MTTGDAYDFYPCLVDDAPASIYVNLRFEHEQLAAHNTRYTVAIRMRDRGEHGIGTAEEAADMNLVEEAIIECAAFVNWRRVEQGKSPVLALVLL